MSNEVVERLMSSFSLLESAISGAIVSLNSREDIPTHIVQRIESYTNLLVKQKEIATELSLSVERADWADVARKIQLINGLLELIRQDAKEIVGSLRGEDTLDDGDDISIC